MQRKIIKIDRDKCNGCGNCVTGCAEGALAIIDGKAEIVKDIYCDGFGDCIGTCPTDALSFEEREAEAFDPDAVLEHVRTTRGEAGATEFQAAHKRHEAKATAPKISLGCPGMQAKVMAREHAAPVAPADATPKVLQPEIQQWPLQLHLVPPGAPFFQNREFALISTCSPLAAPDVNWRFARGRGIAVACPKLDRTEGYVDKLAAILADPSIPKITVVRMSVPCCGGLTQIALQAAVESGRSDLVVEEATVSLEGDILETKQVNR
ncbi:MAG: 4Fe-4S ferredoxin [Lentisphaerae bacterium]|jgi:NAD-dependent dihydropyrimidine dehydrogenase PreA subunit|nr:4Fe-4S ferredoxin [Lentisphaerota bacterium]MBT4821656.1 4Fe-4S ferredoxin [Lentisphaerota bacterium]MBT5612900.1 4Fe-4S ferredoxin [Lentisphaerota bacterium]MBT7060954.1 4Fe-4S ferredoxin [Lentisphaerota bacterium]MBT7846979.1 4Fe-4S ferredoxin [Lentisphaerota bacterium]